MPANSLIIIDMEHAFLRAFNPHRRQRLIDKVSREFERAVQRGDNIILLYSTQWQTISEIADKGGDYQCLHKRRKSDQSGAKDVFAVTQEQSLPVESFRLCGVHSDLCVLNTAVNLTVLFPSAKVEVIKDACDTHNDAKYKWSDYDFGQARRVHLI
ncbi:MAG: isochorismatase family protein [Candidatus Obscuribacterales bacterium]|nr:isochorismatase family protein [Candidatus Obscuribacterales bacterium]